MARSVSAHGSQDLIGRISDTIASHPRLTAAAAFQMGVLLGQAMQNSGALRGIGRKVAAAPGMIASRLPTFGLFETVDGVKRKVKAGARTGKRASAKARVTTATRRTAAKRSNTRRSKRPARA
jgi:hypothetical protein